MRAYVSMYSHDNFHAVESTEIEIPLHQFRAVISFFGLNMVRVSEHKFKLMTKHMFQFFVGIRIYWYFQLFIMFISLISTDIPLPLARWSFGPFYIIKPEIGEKSELYIEAENRYLSTLVNLPAW